jgi:HlyD family secretion protein
MPQGNKLFREEALDRLSSPEQLDKLMRVVSPQTWLPLVSTGCLIVGAGVWSVVGRIPLTVTGAGVLIRPRHVVQFQAPKEGQILNINVKAGDRVKQGQVLATIDQSQLQKELELEKAKLAQLQQQNQSTLTLQKQQIALQVITLQQQQKDLEESLRRESVAPTLREQTLKVLEQKRLRLEESVRREQVTPVLRQQTLAALAEKRKSLLERKQQISALLKTLLQRVEARRGLFEEKIVSQDVVLQSEQELLNAQTQVSDIDTQLKELDVQKTNTEREYLQNLTKVDDIKNAIKEIDVQVINTEREYQQNLNRIDEFQTNLQEIQVQKTNAEREYLQAQNRIDEFQTKIKEIEAQKSQVVQQDVEKSIDKTNQTQVIKDKISQLEVQLAQSSQVISKHDGYVLETSVMPGQIVGASTRLGIIEAEDSNVKLESLVYLADKDGKQIKQGMNVQVTPSVVKRERYGGIVGVVTKVSPFPVTTQEIAAIVGNEELAKSLAGENGARVQIFVQLQEDATTKSGYNWSSSKGPELKLSSGTTTLVRVKVGEVAPISYIIPMFRSWTGVY